MLAASNRGHTVEDVYRACELIKGHGFELGIQLMIGLPQDSMEKCVFSAKETVSVAPSIARLYPTIVLRDTRLYSMYREGSYKPLSTEEAVSVTKEMYRILQSAGINIIRVGLKSTDLITEGGEIRGDTFHPAFRQLVEGEAGKGGHGKSAHEAYRLRSRRLIHIQEQPRIFFKYDRKPKAQQAVLFPKISGYKNII